MKSIRCALLAVCLTILQSAHGQAPEAGRLLVSTDSIDDRNFARTVMLILVHDNGSSAALFLNRPTWIDPVEAFPDIEELESYTDSLYLGGPVGPDQLLILFEHDGVPPVGARNLFGNVYFSATTDILETIDAGAADAPRVRVYAGHAQWAADQLTREVAAGNWRVIPAAFADVFTDEPTELWGRLRADRDDVTAALADYSFSIE